MAHEAIKDGRLASGGAAQGWRSRVPRSGHALANREPAADSNRAPRRAQRAGARGRPLDFLLGFLRNPREVASIVPSSRTCVDPASLPNAFPTNTAPATLS